MLNKEDLITRVSKNCKVNKKITKKVVDELFNTIKECLIRDEEFRISGLGKFGTRIRKPFESYDLQTKSMRLNTERRLPYFKPSDTLKKEIRMAE